MSFKIVLALCVIVAVASAVPGSAGPWGGAGGWGGPGGWGGLGGWGGPSGWGGAGVGGWSGAAAGPVSNPWVPSWISSAPWFPQWGPCTMIGTTCQDCNTRLVCTKVGGLQRACSDPALPHCNLGECSATPSDECAVTAAPAEVEA